MRECKRSLVLILLKILGDAGLRVGQVVEDGLVAGFEHLRFETRPPALGLGVIVAVAWATLRAPGLVVGQ